MMILFGIIAGLIIALLVLRLAFPLPDRSSIRASHALAPPDKGLLVRHIADLQRAHPGKSGVIPLTEGNDALASRLALARMATRSIDVQYYIWKDDISGRLLLGALMEAANRGVRVRLLLDDNGITGLDADLAALDRMPNFEVRLFNPSTVRAPKMLGFAYDFFRMNRRMHNKAFIVDGSAAIIGGRNIGDEYFRIGDESFFLDLDVIGLGPVVRDTAALFDRYWNSLSVYPLALIVKDDSRTPADIAAKARVAAASPATATLVKRYGTSAEGLERDAIPVEWTDVQLFADDPAKGLGQARGDMLMVTRLEKVLTTAKSRVDLVSAYFIPGPKGAEMAAERARQGVRFRILTNAYTTTDVKLVHSGYIKYRKALLEAGVQLFELKPGTAPTAGKPASLAGSSSASLHAKSFAMDDAQIFIGSFNFDPRSAHLNCEMGFLIDSPTLARQMREGFDKQILYASYQPEIGPDGAMIWKDHEADGSVETLSPEPGTTGFDRFLMRVMGWFPIERWL